MHKKIIILFKKKKKKEKYGISDKSIDNRPPM